VAFLKQSKMCSDTTVELLQVREDKLRELAKMWPAVKGQIQSIQI
jgi:hypothetical protein